MSLTLKRFIIGALGALFLLSLVFVQWLEVARKQQEAGLSSTLSIYRNVRQN